MKVNCFVQVDEGKQHVTQMKQRIANLEEDISFTRHEIDTEVSALSLFNVIISLINITSPYCDDNVKGLRLLIWLMCKGMWFRNCHVRESVSVLDWSTSRPLISMVHNIG